MSSPVAPFEVMELQKEVERLTEENKQLRDKAIRFDLDQAGIEKREALAVEVVELRARVAEIDSAFKQFLSVLETWQKQATKWLEDIYLTATEKKL